MSATPSKARLWPPRFGRVAPACLLLCSFALASCVLAQTVPMVGVSSNAGGVALQNPGFEGDFKPVPERNATDAKGVAISGQVAPGWDDNSSWANVSINYSADTTNPHQGRSSQRVSTARVDSGAAQLVQSVQLSKGRAYEFRVWLRGSAGNSLSLLIRRASGDYATFAETTAQVSPEWREARVVASAPDDEKVFLMLRSSGPQTYWVDDASLTDITDAVGKAPREGNLIPGGDFEAGVSFGYSVRSEGPSRNEALDPRPFVDASNAAVGQKSLGFRAPEGNAIEAQGPLVEMTPNGIYTLSLWLRASEPCSVEVAMRRPQPGQSAFGQSFDVGTGWKRYTVGGKAPFDNYSYLRVYTNAREGGPGLSLWMDGVMLEAKAHASPRFVPSEPVELTLEVPRPGRIVFEDEQVEARIGLSPNLPRGAKLRLSVEDILGGRRDLPSLALPAKSVRLPLYAVLGRTRGAFKLRGVVVDARDQEISAPVEAIYARLPRPRAIAPMNSFFGIHTPLKADYIAAALATGNKWTRLHDTSLSTKWATVEAQRGQFRFADAGIREARRQGLSIIGLLDGAPEWTSTQKREGYFGFYHVPDKPGMTQEWRDYVRRTVAHYKNSIDVWEVWNEPWGAFYLESGNPNATPQLYSELLQIAFESAKTENPRAYILGVDTTRGYDDKWTKPVLKAAGTQFFDALSFHDYNDALYGGPQPPSKTEVETFAALQHKYGVAKPIWNTEGGAFAIGSWYAPITGGVPARTQMSLFTRYDITMMGAGVRHYIHYSTHSDPYMGQTDTRNIEHDRAQRPGLVACAILAYLVDGAATPRRFEPLQGVDDYRFPNGVRALWSYDESDHTLQVPAKTRVLDVLGNPLTPRNGQVTVTAEPIYFVRS